MIKTAQAAVLIAVIEKRPVCYIDGWIHFEQYKLF
jgi:hypothetical protein